MRGRVLMVAIACAGASGGAQVRSRAAPLTAFDTALGRVPLSLRSVSLPDLYRALSRPQKGELETTEEWHKRVNRKRGPASGRFYAAWYVPTACAKDSVFAYDADAQDLYIHVPLEERLAVWNSGSSLQPAFVPIQCSRVRNTIRSGVTAMGVPGKYHSSEWHNSGLLLPGDVDEYEEREGLAAHRVAPIWLGTPVPSDTVRLLRRHLRYLLVFKVDSTVPEARQTAYGLHAHTPKLDEPWELAVANYAIVTEQVSIWVIDGRNGTALRKLELPGPRRYRGAVH